jgi:hypothetical protein
MLQTDPISVSHLDRWQLDLAGTINSRVIIEKRAPATNSFCALDPPWDPVRQVTLIERRDQICQ